MNDGTGKVIGITLISAVVGILFFWATTGTLAKQTQEKTIEAIERIMSKPIKTEMKSEVVVKHENLEGQDNLPVTNPSVPNDSIR